ncbi:MAG: hypothetical protein H0T75_15320 [Rhizobiales bacterium]|nr:hypothetical protein [Hyphomicrobiales bacterium]MDQ3561237.1 hypothetical protein [Pseudomonadota bacterium]
MGAWRAAAFLWGVAEASFFFLVPDILLSLVVQKRGVRPASDAACFAVAGACLGGLIVWHIGRGDPAGARAFLDGIPAISSAMIAQAGESLRDNFAAALFAGAFSGVPYKVFAAVAPSAGIGWPEFLLVSAPARACRFLVVIMIVAAADGIAARWLGARERARLLLAGWAAFYVIFWLAMGN